MIESDRCRLLVVDACDTMSRMSDKIMHEAAAGISEHLEGVLLEADNDQIEDVVAASMVVVMAIMKPISESMLAATSDRHARARSRQRELDEFPVPELPNKGNSI